VAGYGFQELRVGEITVGGVAACGSMLPVEAGETAGVVKAVAYLIAGIEGKAVVAAGDDGIIRNS